ncbi:MAG: CsgG/HfaB family protein [Acidobacteriota bacterium]
MLRFTGHKRFPLQVLPIWFSFFLISPTQAIALRQQPNLTYAPKLRIAVVDFSGSAFKETTQRDRNSRTTTVSLPAPAEFALGLTEMLTTELLNTGRFIITERAKVREVLGEQDFGASGRVNKETAAAKGKIIGAELLITGDITEFTYNRSSLGGTFKPLKILKAQSERVTAMVALDIRLIDATTGEVTFAHRSEGKAAMTGVSADLTRNHQEFSISSYENTPLGQASREAIEGALTAIIAQIKKTPWAGRVIDVRNDLVYINVGADFGIRAGMEFDIYEPQDPLIDPTTGKTLGTPDRKMATIKIVTVEEKYSVAEVLTGEGIKRNHLVRFKGQPQKP